MEEQEDQIETQMNEQWDQAKDMALSKDMPKLEQTYSELFKKVTKLDPTGVFHKTNCKFCNHPIRHEAETKWDQVGRSFAPVERLFRAWEADNPNYPKMTNQNVSTHLYKHYAQQEKKMWLAEYVDDCKAYMNYKISQDRRFEMLRTMIEKQLFEIAANPKLDVIKQSDQMVKLGKMVLDIDECQAKLRGDLKPVNVITERFMNVWLHVIKNQEDEKVRHQLQQALDHFQECIEGGTME